MIDGQMQELNGQSRIKSKTFGRKASRMRPAEREALQLHLESLRVPDDELINERTLGFGNGEFLYDMALRHPEANFVGIEVFITGVAKLIRRMCQYNNENTPSPQNIRILIKDGEGALRENFMDNTISGVFILFPDPWPKKRHHKRRLIKPGFIQLLYQRLRPGGTLLIVTDHDGYAEEIGRILEASPLVKGDQQIPPSALNTKYAQRAISEGRTPFIFNYQKPSSAANQPVIEPSHKGSTDQTIQESIDEPKETAERRDGITRVY